jgi:TonB-dependent receptor
MKPLRLTLTGLLLATTAMAAPHLAYAQAQGGQGGSGQPAAAPGSTSPDPAAQSTPEQSTPEQNAAQDPATPEAAEAQDPSSPTEVGEIVVLGRNIPEPLRETSEVVSILTTEDLQRQGDDNAATALTRVAGLSLVQGRFVYVRGLGERYSSALLNGSPLPSPEPLQRVVPLDLFPANVLESTNVQKTYSPELPGEFGGGVIDLRTLGTPDERFFTIGISTGRDSETTLEPGITYYGGDADFFGYDDSTRRIPRRLSQALESGKQVTIGNFGQDIYQIGRDFVNAPLTLLQGTDNLQPDVGLDLSAGDSFEFGDFTFGVIGVLGFDNAWQTRTGLQQRRPLVQGNSLVPLQDFGFTSTQNDVVTNALLGFGLEWDGNRIDWTNLYVHSTTKEARIRQGEDALNGVFSRTDATEWFERSLINTQLAGSHEFEVASGDLSVDWRAAYAKTTRDAPYEREITYVRSPLDQAFVYDPSGSRSSNETRFSEVEDQVTSGGVDLSYTLPLSGVRDAVFSAGYAFLDNERQSEARSFRFQVASLTEQQQRQRVDFLFSDFNIGPGRFVLEETTGGEGAAAYDAKLKVNAVYAQVDAEIIPLVRVAGGLRYEDGEQSVLPRNLFDTPSPIQLVTVNLQEQYVLPAATVTWNFYEDMQLRFGASKTIARPQFRELAQQVFQDPESDRFFIGNPGLVDSELLNLDARYEWFFEGGQYLTAGVFYKKIDKPIESIFNVSGGVERQSFVNAPEATLYGFEVDGRKYFDIPERYAFLPGESRVFLAANYTYTTSEVTAAAGDQVRIFDASAPGGIGSRPATQFVEDGSRLQGQSDHLANVQFGLENDDTRTQATFLLNYVSDRITARGERGAGGVIVQPDIVNDPGVTLDFVLRQGFDVVGREFTFGLEARNLTGENFEEYQEFGAGRIDRNTFDLGTILSVSLTARF